MTILLLIAAGTTHTSACPPGPCNKYRQRQLPAVEPQVQTYRRAIRGTLPPRYTRAMLERFLAGSAWQPIAIGAVSAQAPTLPPRTIRFVDPARVERRAVADRIVLLRQLERRANTMYVEIDGEFFALSRCRDGRFTTTCLDRVGALPPEPEATDHRFATPP